MIIAGRTSWENIRRNAEGDSGYEKLLFIYFCRSDAAVLGIMFLCLDFCVGVSMRVKKIELEMYFDDDFCPPEKFEEPNQRNNYSSKCKTCPFFGWQDEDGFGWCNITAVRDTNEEYPIKKFFN